MTDRPTDAEIEAAFPSIVEREKIENMRADFFAGRHIMASDANTAIRVIDRLDHALEAAAKARGDGWQPIETAPTDGRRLWISDGETVWFIFAHADGSHRRAAKCKFWMTANWPDPPAPAEKDQP